MKVQTKMPPNRRARNLSLLHWSRNILFVIGILALGYYGYAVVDARIFQAYQTRQFEQAVSRSPLDSSLVETSNPQLYNAATPLPVAHATAPSSGTFVRPVKVLGQIEIRKIGLAVMILDSIDSHSLRRAVGHVPDTALPGQPGNVVIAGHRDTFFRDLRKITKNDEILLKTFQGPIRYVIDFSEVVGPNDTEVLEPSSDSILTLVTCYPFHYVGDAPKRFIVRAHMIPE
jgi:sortase A